MDAARTKMALAGMAFHCLYLCAAGPALAADVSGTVKAPLFEPGKEYHVLTDNEHVGTGRFNLYVPRDYTADRDWPVIFRYKGRGTKYNPIVCRGPRSATCDRGAIVVGMGYVPSSKKRMTADEYRDSIRRDFKSIHEVRKMISKHLRVDDERLFLAGSSAGGWLAANLLEYRAQYWAGAMIFVAGRHQFASLLTNGPSVRAFRGLPVFFGSSLPGDSHGSNYPWAVQGASIYEHRGAVVTFQVYAKGQWLAFSPLLRDWVRAYLLDGKSDSIDEKMAKWRRLTRMMPRDIDSTAIIKAQIAKALNKPRDRLTNEDLLDVRELSLMGLYVSDIAYLARLKNLESLDISFTYVESAAPLLGCKRLRTLDISDTHIKDLSPLGNLPQLETLSMWNLWLDREHIDALKAARPGLIIIDYQWDLYETDAIGRVLPKRKVTLN